ncbi:MAG: hypothetical protein IJV99_03700 [Clostridia bacterium]|nr:hypothetical protein [Clostridia bacterium]
MRKRFIAVLLSALLAICALSLFGCKKEEKTYAINYQLTNTIDGTEVSVKVDGKNSLRTKRFKASSSLIKAIEKFESVEVVTDGYEFIGWGYIKDGTVIAFNELTKVKNAVGEDGKVTIVPICNLIPVYIIKYQLDYKYAQFSKYGVKYKNSYTKVNGQATLADIELLRDSYLITAIEGLATPVVVDKNGEVVSSEDADFYFSGWHYLLDGKLYEVTSDTKVSETIAVNGTITLVAYCKAAYVGPY